MLGSSPAISASIHLRILLPSLRPLRPSLPRGWHAYRFALADIFAVFHQTGHVNLQKERKMKQRTKGRKEENSGSREAIRKLRRNCRETRRKETSIYPNKTNQFSSDSTARIRSFKSLLITRFLFATNICLSLQPSHALSIQTGLDHTRQTCSPLFPQLCSVLADLFSSDSIARMRAFQKLIT